jgi:hypothetical protein
MMRKGVGLFCLSCFIIVCAHGNGLCWEQGVSVGYGFAAYNDERHTGKIEGGEYYDFSQLSYILETPLSVKNFQNLTFLIEPFAAYVGRPNSGTDFGFHTGIRYYLVGTPKAGFYTTIGAGLAYTTIGFKEQGTHMLGILMGGLGLRYRDFFIENRFRHYSNGGTASPNWSVNANVITLGMYF